MKFCFLIILCVVFLYTELKSAKIKFSENNYKYALNLFHKKDYYRSITEFKRYIFFSKNKTKQNEAKFYIGLNYFNAKDYQNAKNIFYQIYDTPSHTKREIALLKMADSHFHEEIIQIKPINNYYFFPALFSTEYFTQYLKEYRYNYLYFNEAYSKLVFINILNLNQYNAFYLLNNNKNKDKKYQPIYKHLYDQAKKIDDIPQRSKIFSTILSVLIPGMGQIYAGEVKEGIIALFVNVAVGYTAYHTYVNYSKFLGIVIGYYELTFYIGNINNAQNAVEKFNENEKNIFRQEVLNIQF